jgi:putative tryptophan/tyrosine transport system substrate-binding protein
MRIEIGQRGLRYELLRYGHSAHLAQHSVLYVVFCAVLFAVCGSAGAQQTDKIFRIGYFDPSSASSSAVLVDAFRDELRKLGWIDGKNITIERRFLNQDLARASEVAAALVHLSVDVIVVTGTVPATAAKSATKTIPIVMANVGDPVGAGLVASLAHPGGNITGLSGLAPDLNTKRLEVLNDTVPNLTRVGVLKGAGADLANNLQLRELRTAAVALKIKLEEIDAKIEGNGLEAALQSANQKQVKAIMTTASPRLFAVRRNIVELVEKQRFPAIYFQKEFVDEGGLMSYGLDYDNLFRESAHYVNNILKGGKPGDLPVQQPTKFEFIINLKAAKQISLTIPVHVLERANQIIR